MQIPSKKILISTLLIALFSTAMLPVLAQQQVPSVDDAKAPSLAFYQGKPFYEAIRKFQQEDSIRMPASKSILLIGSSSFTYWKDVATYFPGYRIVNRGFGGSSLPDLIRYQDYIIYPYDPKQILIYCGENDFAAADTVTVTTVVNRFKQLFWDIRVRLPRVPISYISMKPSPSRAALLPKFKEANQQIKAFLATQKGTTYIDVYQAMLQSDGRPIGEIFTSDSLHMNPKGYLIWQKQIRYHLKKTN
ncbi:GDSL-type esterase/lipase family protein [Flavihumibacter cheonanensis]|uniref:GDSL-type esterase/lipase family protein n=1 Tax=Flavihumibacter cheonanensis TaxID=1442385 RepID=UPI001EF99BD1|nr:GDSL-type esterase/lipase family protein [Flavihumibacter cheonanensis]MCG7754770.1 GDSL-type esterase/lipase family protein [Flavihumibacter cheonanensis]